MPFSVRPPRSLAVLFLIVSLPVVILQVYATPPFQVADEENHFLRAVQIAGGQLFGQKLGGGGAGGIIDPAANEAAHAFDGLKFHPDVKLDTSRYGDVAALRWSADPPQPVGFANTAIYPAFFYLPAAVALSAARAAGMSVLDSFYLGRLATALVAVALSASALALCGKGRTTLFVILCFPMVLSLFASVSQDALSLSFAALAVALWSHYAARDADMPPRIRALGTLLLGAVIAARLPFFPVYVLALVPTSGRHRLFSRDWLGRSDLAAAALGLLPVVYGIVGAQIAKITFRVGENVSPAAQMRWIVSHPTAAAHVAMDTLVQTGAGNLRQMVGVLGWLDTDLPGSFYLWIVFCLAAALMIDALSPERGLGNPWHWIGAAAAIVSAAAVFGALYLAWTPVGATLVDGVQGRYLLVPAMLLAITVPAVGRASVASSSAGDRTEGLRLALCGCVGLIDLWVVPMTILHRYYG